MRRLIFPSSLLVLLASWLVIAAPGPAGATGSVPHIVCPQQSTIVPCCPVPSTAAVQAGARYVPCCPQSSSACCAPGPTCCATICPSGALSIASSPDPSTTGRKVVISGGLTSNPVSGTQVVLWRELAGQSSFHKLAQTATDSAGQYTFTMKRGSVNADQRWYVTANGLTSPTLQQNVNALVGLAAASHTATAGQPVALTGHVTPSHAGQVVLVEQSRGGSWAVIARPRLSNSSGFKLSHRFSHAGAVKLRAVLPADTRNNRSNSPTLTVTVK
jgi:hypothetical protein